MKKRLWRIIIGGVVLLGAALLPINNPWINVGLFIISYIIVGGDVVVMALRNIIKGNGCDE